MQAIFAWDCGNLADHSTDSATIIKSIEPINQLIHLHAPKWPLEKINKVDLAILRCAIWELQVEAKTPPKVIIDEAIELAKEFGTDTSAPFINGVLGSIINQHEPSQSA
jgi:N utilization substance protein B